MFSLLENISRNTWQFCPPRFIYIYIWNSELKERGKESSSILSWLQWPQWCRLKPGTSFSSFIWLQRCQHLAYFSVAFPGQEQGAVLEVEQLVPRRRTLMGCPHLHPISHRVDPNLFLHIWGLDIRSPGQLALFSSMFYFMPYQFSVLIFLETST